MKKFILALFLLLSTSSSAQNVVRQGKVFRQVSHKTVRDTLVTDFLYEDSKGKTYKIIVNKANGHCYIWRKSKKGRMYRVYFTGKKAYISTNICDELHIKYISK